MTTYKKQLKDKNGNIIYPDVGIDLGNVVYSDDPTTPIGDVVNPFDYSTTTDLRIGTYNGKPLYRHLSQFTTPSNAYTFTRVNTGLPAATNFAFIETGWVTGNSPDAWQIQINSARPQNDTECMNSVSGCWVRFQPGYSEFAVSVGSSITSLPAVIVVLYTKSTD